jgi:hypothetical protein
MDFAFIQASTNNYKRPKKSTDHIVTSYDSHTAHLIIVNSASCRVWAFFTKSKDPPLDILWVFMENFGLGTGVVRTDQGRELAQSASFQEMMLKDFGYVRTHWHRQSFTERWHQDIQQHAGCQSTDTPLWRWALRKVLVGRPPTRRVSPQPACSLGNSQDSLQRLVRMQTQHHTPQDLWLLGMREMHALAPTNANLTATTSPASSLAIQQQIRTSRILTWTLASSKPATMLFSTKPGTSNQPAPLQLNFSTTLDWKQKQNSCCAKGPSTLYHRVLSHQYQSHGRLCNLAPFSMQNLGRHRHLVSMYPYP